MAPDLIPEDDADHTLQPSNDDRQRTNDGVGSHRVRWSKGAFR